MTETKKNLALRWQARSSWPLGGRHARARALPAVPLRAQPPRSGSQVHLLPRFLKPFPSLGLSPNLLSTLAATTGRAAPPFVLSSPSALPATSASSRYAPLLFPSAVRDGAPQTLTKLFVFGSESSYNILPTNFDFVCENYRVYMCAPMSYAGSAPTNVLLESSC